MGEHTALYDARLPLEQQQAALHELEQMLQQMRATELSYVIERLQEALSETPEFLEDHPVLLLIEGLSDNSGAGTARPAGAIRDYVECLKDACKDAGGEWHEGGGRLAGCRCNVAKMGWGYCSASAALYLMGSQWCWWSFLSPFK